jgi:hypothetical protein
LLSINKDSLRPLDLDNPPLHRNRNCLRAVTCAKLFQDVLYVSLHGLFRDKETISNIPISVPCHGQLQHFYFTFGQRIIAKMFSDAIDRFGGGSTPARVVIC